MADLGAIATLGSESGRSMSATGKNTSFTMPGSLGALKGVSMYTTTTVDGSGTGGRPMITGITRDDVEGSPGTPSMKMLLPGMWRFRWSVKPGTRSVSVKTKQSGSTERPSMVVRANPDVGLPADLSATGAISADWVTIGPASFTATATGSVWVEMWNNYYCDTIPAYFDHIVVT